MFHLLGGYRPSSSVIPAGTIGQIPALLDNHIRVTNNHYVLEREHKLYWHFLYASSSVANRIQSDAFRNTGPQYAVPNGVGPASFDETCQPLAKISQMRRIPPYKEFWHEVETLAIADVPTNLLSGIIIGDGNLSYPDGEVTTLRFTFPCSRLVGGWYRQILTPFQPITPGTYAVIGATHDRYQDDDTVFAFRLRFQNQEHIPGAPSHKLQDTWYPQMFRFGGLGLWGTFTESSVPQLEWISEGLIADNTANLYLDVVKLH